MPIRRSRFPLVSNRNEIFPSACGRTLQPCTFYTTGRIKRLAERSIAGSLANDCLSSIFSTLEPLEYSPMVGLPAPNPFRLLY